MKIMLADHENTELVYHLLWELKEMLDKSRFKGFVEVRRWNSRKAGLNITQIRLDKSKPYCGSHPNACEVVPGEKPRKATFLEGADWVEFNDLLNDVLDRNEVDAIVEGVVVDVRHGRLRRVNYDSYETGDERQPYEWEKSGITADYQDWCGKTAPDSTYPEGTPGTYNRKAA